MNCHLILVSWSVVFQESIDYLFSSHEYVFIEFFLQGDLIMISMILKVNELRITVLTQISTAALTKISTLQMQHLFETIIMVCLNFVKSRYADTTRYC